MPRIKRFLIELFSVFLFALLLFFLERKYGRVFFANPKDILLKFFDIISSKKYLGEIALSFFRSFIAFLITIFISVILAILSFNSPNFKSFLSFYLGLFKALPIASLILILFLFQKSYHIPITASFLMCFPLSFSSIFDSLSKADEKYKELLLFYKINKWIYYFKILLVSIYEDILSVSKRIFPLSIKVVISSEIMLSLSRGGLGSQIASSSLSLDSVGVFAFSLMAVLLSFLSILLLDAFDRAVKHCLRDKQF